MITRHTQPPAITVITGNLRVYVVPCEPLAADQSDELYAVLERFLDALRLRMFFGALRVVHGIARGDDGKLDASLDVVELELGALRVLHGMLRYFSVMTAPLGTMMAWLEPVGSTPNLLDSDASWPVCHGTLPFHANFHTVGSGAAPPLVIEVVFARALTDDEKDRLDHEIRAWAALVNGGYPQGGDLPGSSAIGPLTVRYDDPQTLRLHAEALLAGNACFEPLKTLVAGWSARIPVLSLEVE